MFVLYIWSVVKIRILLKKRNVFCTNCCVIHGYTILEYDFKFNEYNENIYNLLKCKNTIYKR